MERKITIEEHRLYKEDYQLRMLERNKIEGMLPVKGRGMNESTFYDYDVSGKISIRAMYERSKISSEDIKNAEDELHKTFATLSQEEQKFANIFLHDIQSGDVQVVPGKTFKEYVIEYVSRAKNDQIHRLSKFILGVDEEMLRNLMSQHITEDNINEFGRFDALKATVDKTRAKAYFEGITGLKLPIPKVNIRVDKLLRDFILKGGYDIEMPE